MFFLLHRNICIRKTPNLRLQKVQASYIAKGSIKPHKALTVGLLKKGGRNYTGRKMFMSQGGGHKQRFRLINHKTHLVTDPTGCISKVLRLEYDPNRTSWIALIEQVSKTNPGNRKLFYTVATHGVKVGDFLEYGPVSPINPGNRLPLSGIPIGTYVHSVELHPGFGSKIARSAGTSCRIVRNTDTKVLLSLPSGQRFEVAANCSATIGQVSNILHEQKVLGKAGVSRWLGIRPSSRGVAKNPVDHPHGGRTKGGCHAKTPWGKLTRGVRTRSPRKVPLMKLYK